MTDWKPAMRVPDPAVRVLDERFRRYVLPLAKLERLATGCRWAEGPVWFGDHRTLVWSDIPNDRMLRWDAPTRRCRCSASRPTTPTATPGTSKDGWSPASTAAARLPAPSTTARSPCWPTA